MNPIKAAGIFSLQEQMRETKAWKILKEVGDKNSCRLYWAQIETVQHVLVGCDNLAGMKNNREHSNVF